MASVFLTGNSTTQTILENGQFAYIASGAHLVTTYSAIESQFDGAHYASDNVVRIYGAVGSISAPAINLWGDSLTGGGHSVEVGATGTVDCLGSFAAVRV